MKNFKNFKNFKIVVLAFILALSISTTTFAKKQIEKFQSKVKTDTKRQFKYQRFRILKPQTL